MPNDKTMQYKAKPVAQEFLQRPRVDYEKIYSIVVDGIILQYLISLVIHERDDIASNEFNL